MGWRALLHSFFDCNKQYKNCNTIIVQLKFLDILWAKPKDVEYVIYIQKFTYMQLLHI
jgi:hypothetical protein